jgi:membrane protein YdbS with pleckstrin-like domain
LNARTRPAPSGEASLTLRPVFVPALSLSGAIPFAMFLSLWAGGFFGGFSMFAIEALDLALPKWFPFVLFGGLTLVGIPYLSFTIHKKTYQKTEYRFFPDRLEYYEGFLTVEEKNIPLANVTEVNLRKGALQSKYGLGTVILSTPATMSGTRAGIRIADIENPDEVYQSVKRLIDRGRRGTAPAPPQAA